MAETLSSSQDDSVLHALHPLMVTPSPRSRKLLHASPVFALVRTLQKLSYLASRLLDHTHNPHGLRL